MPTKQKDAVQEWISNGIKYLAVCVISMGVYVFNNLNKTLEQMNVQLRVMEAHQIETDKRVAAIEVSREINMASYQKMVADVSEMKQSMIQITMRVQTIAEFVAKRGK